LAARSRDTACSFRHHDDAFAVNARKLIPFELRSAPQQPHNNRNWSPIIVQRQTRKARLSLLLIHWSLRSMIDALTRSRAIPGAVTAGRYSARRLREARSIKRPEACLQLTHHHMTS
jgi:hypothetical protein